MLFSSLTMALSLFSEAAAGGMEKVMDLLLEAPLHTRAALFMAVLREDDRHIGRVVG